MQPAVGQVVLGHVVGVVGVVGRERRRGRSTRPIGRTSAPTTPVRASPSDRPGRARRWPSSAGDDVAGARRHVGRLGRVGVEVVELGGRRPVLGDVQLPPPGAHRLEVVHPGSRGTRRAATARRRRAAAARCRGRRSCGRRAASAPHSAASVGNRSIAVASSSLVRPGGDAARPADDARHPHPALPRRALRAPQRARCCRRRRPREPLSLVKITIVSLVEPERSAARGGSPRSPSRWPRPPRRRRPLRGRRGEALLHVDREVHVDVGEVEEERPVVARVADEAHRLGRRSAR